MLEFIAYLCSIFCCFSNSSVFHLLCYHDDDFEVIFIQFDVYIDHCFLLPQPWIIAFQFTNYIVGYSVHACAIIFVLDDNALTGHFVTRKDKLIACAEKINWERAGSRVQRGKLVCTSVGCCA